MRFIFIVFLSIITIPVLQAQNAGYNLDTHAIYDSSGAKLSYNTVIETLRNSEVVLFGEFHNDAMIHYIQLKVIKDLMKTNKLVLGGEFFERDDQLKIDEYISGRIAARNFEAEARLWSNYKTDYKPIVDLARDSGIAFIATNVPRRYAALVAKGGLDTLSALSKDAKKLFPSLPIAFTMDTPGYGNMMEMMGGHGGGSDKIVQAQALKDATMAQSIKENLQKNSVFVHINGDYHSAHYGGIYWYLKKLSPKIDIKTIKVFSSDSLDFEQEYKSSGDIILVVPEDFTKTH